MAGQVLCWNNSVQNAGKPIALHLKKTISHLQAKGCQFTPWLALQVLLGFLILRDRQEKIRNTLLGKKKRSSADIMCHIMS